MNEYIETNYREVIEKSVNPTLATISAYQSYLDSTDYVVIKMSESMVKGVSTEELVTKYQDVLNDRDEARRIINELESTL